MKKALFLALLLVSSIAVCNDQDMSDTESEDVDITPEQLPRENIVNITRSPRFLNLRELLED
jgi:hypothetical protein